MIERKLQMPATLTGVERVANETLGVDPRRSFTRNALEAFSTALLESGERWLPLSKAEDVVNALLPDREFERSLYRGLVVEGLLVEEAGLQPGRASEEVVFVAYERFADHLAAKTLLDRHLAHADPHAAFAPGKPLAFLNDSDERNYIAPGLLEALCVQIPERIGKELIDLAPNSIDRWGMGDAFRQSLVWRAYSGFSDGTRDALNKLTRSKHDLHDTVDVLLTVATLPGHPLNATFLDQRLRRDSMPNRDVWWSVYLHQAWGSHGAVDRLVDWASSLTPTTFIDDESVDLCAIALSWLLTTSNRFLRDRATKALVSLLTGRLEAVTRLVERFADVNDPYVAERVYAVAYGVAMRCHDPVEVGALAACVYARVFATGSPPPHILLRDYARGVVERALYLRSGIEVIAERIRPPYDSQWPTIPTEEAITPLLPDWSRGSHDSGEVEWARNHIGSSVMGDDFARYVIGTNSSKTSNHWLSLGLDEPIWKPPARWEDRMRSQLAELSDDERAAWDQFEVADKTRAEASRVFVADWLAQREKEGRADDLNGSDLSALALEIEKARPASIAVLDEQKKSALAAVEAVLTKEHAAGLAEILSSKEDHRHVRRPPGFELSQIQRYILWRVFDLGWTTERFGEFDRFYIRNDGREASKAERIGKKYQWIAYHEIMALVADHFQYREQFRENDGDTAYQGPWQDYLRNIDPSCTLRAIRGGTSWDGHSAAWWGSAPYNEWGEPDDPRQWALNRDNLPNVSKMLLVTNPVDGSRWLNGQCYFNWKQQPPADRESTDVERRELWYICTAYLIRTSEAESFLEWAKGVDFWGRWMPDAAEVHEMFLGEHAWAPASRYFQQHYYGDDGWTNPGRGCPASIRTVAFEYLCEAKGFDCSIDEGYTLRLPVSELVTGLGIRWSGVAADFLDSFGRLAAEDPTAKSDGPSALLLREDILRDYLAKENLTICWAVLGEKRVLSAGFGDGPYHPSLRISGAYKLAEDGPVGFVNYVIDDPNAASGVEAPNDGQVP